MVSALEEKLALLRQGFEQKLFGLLGDLKRSVEKLDVAATNEEALNEIQAIAHRLSGTGATFGYVAISETAANLDRYISSILDDGSQATPPVIQETKKLLGALLQEAANPGNANTEPPVPAPPGPADTGPLSNAPTAALSVEPERCVFLAVDDAELSRELETHLKNYGYSVECFDDPEQLIGAVRTQPFAVIAIDVDLGGRGKGIGTVRRLRQMGPADLPVIFLSEHMDFETRLAAVRAGANGYVFKPVDLTIIVEKLGAVTGATPQLAIRILIIDDDLELGQYLMAVLQDAGMQSVLVTDATQALDEIAEFDPDLILMDLHMPHCTGAELAAVVRQQDAYSGIPIVYLSAEQDFHAQLSAMDVGGDDFLTKPIKPDHLIPIVQSRALRVRAMRALMMHDGLTGLLNHVAAMERMEMEISRASRDNKPLSVALLDLDHFKSVNDNHGHSGGDQVLRSFAQMLQKRFRKTDFVGRYGGEEFVVFLPGTDGETATNIIDGLREVFSAAAHKGENGDFHVTFSGGVASYPGFKSKSDLMEQADKALYVAKAAGRNKIVLAEDDA